MQAKTDLRLAIKVRLEHLSAKDREIESRVLCRNLEKLLTADAMTITGYFPFADEPNIVPFLTHAIEQGHAVALPAIENNALVFRTIASIGDVLKNPVTGLTEPLNTNPVTDRSAIDLVIVPGRGFTRQGTRIGRGNGGYDIWIHSQRTLQPKTRYLGICFECQLLPDLPLEPHDEKMNNVMTDRGHMQKM